MAYLFRQKLHITELVEPQLSQSRVLIYEPERYLLNLYTHHFRSQNLNAHPCADLSQLRQAIVYFQPELLVFNVDALGLWLKVKPILVGLIGDFPDLEVVSIGYDLNSDSIKQLMETGVTGHINRRLSQPKDLVVLAQTLLNN